MIREFLRNFSLRGFAFCWLIFLAAIHLLVGLLLTYGTEISLFTAYHLQIISGFGFDPTDEKALALHQWWLNLFGATLQNLGLLMLLLIFIANQYREAKIWLWMAIGLLIWAPQDMWISMRINLVAHVWLDSIVLILFVPPLIFLWWVERKNSSEWIKS